MRKRLNLDVAHASAVVFALVLVADGCAGGSHRDQPHSGQTSTPDISTPASSSGDGDDKAIAAYRGMWDDMVNASHTADWRDAALKHHATAEALAEMISGLYSMSQKGLVTKGAPVLHPRIAHSSVSEANIVDCESTIAWLGYVAATGKLVNDVPGGHRLIKAHVELADGVWRVTEYTTGELGSC